MSGTAPKVVGPEAVQAAADVILGIDPTQAPTKVALLAERLTVPQPGLVGTLELLVNAGQSKHVGRFLPVLFTMLEAAGRAHPADWGELKSKSFVASINAVTGEARQVLGAGDGAPTPTRSRQPHLAALFDKSFLGEDAPTKNLPLDERLGLYVLLLGAVRAIDRHLLGAEQPVVSEKLPGRNDPCHCGSGKKFKKCHGGVAA